MSQEIYAKTVENLKMLRLPTMADMLDAHISKAAKNETSCLDFLHQLVAEEVEAKKQKAAELRIKQARFPTLKFLSNFDFKFQPSIERSRIEELKTLRFIETKTNVLFLGPPGVGKTHLSIALGIEACKSGYKVLFVTLEEMISSLVASLADNSTQFKLRSFMLPDLLIVDEVGYLPVQERGAQFLFSLVSKRYERGSIILTSNRSFTDWGEMLGNGVIASAILDRLLHYSFVFNIKGKSFRLREKKEAISRETSEISAAVPSIPDCQ